MQERFEGTIIWYDESNGHGIIRVRSDNTTVSIENSQVHHNTAQKMRSLRVGQDVTFEIVDIQAHNLYFL